ncbi:phage virion morphogenesis protein [Sphingomonas sp. IC081]|uniref:phage virion morphogenesis protein n=1 Tax=Sphingomonas sp. IC081 TaxID=304378 RepID=UPI00115A89F9|nr:phage virion morphogenesis protein [Sphingomonas sp. IC081]QDK34542.1 phage virion morphogenesis protein [Sphingomonas sp. IC081]
MADRFAQLDAFLVRELEKLSPARRRRISRKIGMELRKANAKRIAANIQPDGSAMQPRKKRNLKARKDGIKKGRMFRKLRLSRSFKINATPSGVSVGFEGSVAHTARAHQYGLTDFVGHTENGKTVRTKYPERVLLGFTPEDLDLIAEIVFDMLGK